MASDRDVSESYFTRVYDFDGGLFLENCCFFMGFYFAAYSVGRKLGFF